MKDYELEIISREKYNKKLKKYRIDGNDVVGVYENEPFSVRFKNNTCRKVQLRLSVDGTDVLTGKPASTESDGKMWVVNAYSDVELKAWPETTKGGAEFLFGKSEDGVAANTHGIMNGKGIIAAAIFEEQYPQNGVIFTRHVITPSPMKPYWDSYTISNTGGSFSGGVSYNSSLSKAVDDVKCSCNYYDTVLDSDPAVGAGEFVNQEIIKTAGLYNPTLGRIIQVKYEWWTSLKSKLRKHPIPHSTAFPGDCQKLMSLGSTPRKEKRGRRGKRRISPERKYKEFNRFIDAP